MVLPNTHSCDLLPDHLRPGDARSPSNSPSRQTWSQTPSGRIRAWSCGGGNGHRGGGGRRSGGGGSGVGARS
eukprot:16686-Ditylum_brightwellii.AAC.1